MNLTESTSKFDDKGEIAITELFEILWSWKYLVFALIVFFALISVVYALYLPNIYRSSALVAPADNDSRSSLKGISGQIGGLASLAGVNLGDTKVDRTTIAIEVLKSRKFLGKFIEQNELHSSVIAAIGWKRSDNSLVFDEDIFNKEEGWVRKVSAPKQKKPSVLETVNEFKNLLSIKKDVDTGLITIGIEHYSPFIAHEWLSKLITEINLQMKLKDKTEAKRNVDFLNQQLEKIGIAEHRNLLYQLIEEQTKILMFAEVKDEYVFKLVDPPFVPEDKVKPKRALIAIVGTLFGALVGCIVALVLGTRRRNIYKEHIEKN